MTLSFPATAVSSFARSLVLSAVLAAGATGAHAAPIDLRLQAIEQEQAQIHGRIVLAQRQLRPPASVPSGGDFSDDTPQFQPAQDAAGMLLRVDRLENQGRTLNGEVEQLQFQIRRLEEQMRKFQQDVDFRFQENGGRRAPAAKRTDIDDPAMANPQSGVTPGAAPAGRARRSDAFDPAGQGGAPGAPRALGLGGPLGATTAPASGGQIVASTPRIPNGAIIDDDDVSDPSAPLDLSRPGVQPRPAAPAQPRVVGGPSSLGAPTAPARVSPAPSGAPGAQASLTPPAATPRDEYDAALSAYRARQYESAEIGMKGFIQKNPKDRAVPDATYYLGETYAARGRHREAAEQFLKFSTDYAKSGRAPDGMVRLGVALNALGAKEQACATFAEAQRKFSTASESYKTGLERENKRAHC